MTREKGEGEKVVEEASLEEVGLRREAVGRVVRALDFWMSGGKRADSLDMAVRMSLLIERLIGVIDYDEGGRRSYRICESCQRLGSVLTTEM